MQLLRSLIAVDESLGIVIDTLEELGELENTIIIYSSDNGYFMGEHTYRDKRLQFCQNHSNQKGRGLQS